MTGDVSNIFIPVAEPDLSPLEEKYLLEAYRSGWISSIGKFVNRFEKDFANFCGVKHAIAVANGTAALHLCLLAEGIGPGDEVVVPALTFVSTAAAVKYSGADPVFVDSVPDIGTMDPEAVELAITKLTKAIIPVHLYGHPADMDSINAIARKYDIAVIEDAAEAHGAMYKGYRVGNLGKMAAFSFYGNKILTTGEGGMVVTNDGKVAEKIRFFKDHAMDPTRRYWHPEVGYNYRMTNLQAAIGCAQIERFDEIIGKRIGVQNAYRQVFAKNPEIQINPVKSWAIPVPWMVCAILPAKFKAVERDAMIIEMKNRGIDSRPYFNLACDMPPYKKSKVFSLMDDCPVARDLSIRGINLPSLSSITDEKIANIHKIVIQMLQHYI